MKFRFCGDGDCPDWVLGEIHSTLSVLSSIKLRQFGANVVKMILQEESIDEEKFMEAFEGGIVDLKSAYSCVRFLLLSAVRFNVSNTYFCTELQQIGLPREHSVALGKVLDDCSTQLRDYLKSKTLTINELDNVQCSSSNEAVDCIYMKLQIKNEIVNGISQKTTHDINIPKAEAPILLKELKAIRSKMNELDYEKLHS